MATSPVLRPICAFLLSLALFVRSVCYVDAVFITAIPSNADKLQITCLHWNLHIIKDIGPGELSIIHWCRKCNDMSVLGSCPFWLGVFYKRLCCVMYLFQTVQLNGFFHVLQHAYRCFVTDALTLWQLLDSLSDM